MNLFVSKKINKLYYSKIKIVSVYYSNDFQNVQMKFLNNLLVDFDLVLFVKKTEHEAILLANAKLVIRLDSNY
jgi:hypothetical protein